MGTIYIQVWQFILLMAVTWFFGYLFGFFSGRTYGANEVLERFIRKRRSAKASKDTKQQTVITPEEHGRPCK